MVDGREILPSLKAPTVNTGPVATSRRAMVPQLLLQHVLGWIIWGKLPVLGAIFRIQFKYCYTLHERR